MSARDDRVRLKHMLDASRVVEAFAAGRTREDLDRDLQLTFALARAVEIVAEAAKDVSEERRMHHPGVPWRAIAATHHRLVHDPLALDLDRLWHIVSVDVPVLIPHLRDALGETP
ncbi:DUF86 domain-containing protein [Anaeromyxobacter sp. Fw109-5]|uniref:HepT-like ribonuclease domain-containing protein n=1 Tax=Anaeromyxobacter sp. (strain Fw109-5) TaxID=404589 RepID=UPI00059E5A7F|nr:HepT-like ribonuclease domain-containing protein [Anaeromyxobacter sp. Fw109-5]